MKAFFNLRNFLFLTILLFSALLNLYQIDKNPPGLYIDEVSIGVNAYSILKTGKDEYGVKYPLYFRAYGEYKMPFYIYLTSLSMAIFGKNEFAVRFPSAFFGILSIIAYYLLIKEICEEKSRQKFALISTFLISISPWFLHFVGPGFEATVALSLFIFGCFLYIKSQKNGSIFLFTFSLICFVLTPYTYNSYKAVTPVILFIIFVKSLLERKEGSRSFLLPFVTLIFFIPLIYIFFAGYGNMRFFQTTVFQTAPFDAVMLFLKNYISYFSLDFLFTVGDGINRHQFVNFGLLLRWTLPFLIGGAWILPKITGTFFKYFILLLFIVLPIPGALALPSPHTLRSLAMVIPYTLLISLGLLYFLNKYLRFHKLLSIFISMVFIYEFALYLHYGYFHYTKTALIDWGGNYKEVVERATQLHKIYPVVTVNQSMISSIEYFRFYNEDLKPQFIDSLGNKKTTIGDKPVLLITSEAPQGSPPSDKLIDTVYLPNINKNIFAQFWEI